MSKLSSERNSINATVPLDWESREGLLPNELPARGESSSNVSPNSLKQLVFQFLLDYEAERNAELQRRLGLVPSRRRRTSPAGSQSPPSPDGPHVGRVDHQDESPIRSEDSN